VTNSRYCDASNHLWCRAPISTTGCLRSDHRRSTFARSVAGPDPIRLFPRSVSFLPLPGVSQHRKDPGIIQTDRETKLYAVNASADREAASKRQTAPRKRRRLTSSGFQKRTFRGQERVKPQGLLPLGSGQLPKVPMPGTETGGRRPRFSHSVILLTALIADVVETFLVSSLDGFCTFNHI